MPSSEKIVIAGDFNRHIGVFWGGYDDVHGGFGFGDRNGEGVALLDFARAFGLVVVNSSFRRRRITLLLSEAHQPRLRLTFCCLGRGIGFFVRIVKSSRVNIFRLSTGFW